MKKMKISERDKYILKHYKSYNLTEVSQAVGLTRTSTARRARQLGVKMTHKKQEFTKTYKDEFGVRHPIGWVRKTPEEISAKISKRVKEWYKHNPHPKGFKGKKRPEEFKKMMSNRIKELWRDKNSKYNSPESRQIKSDNMSRMMIERMSKMDKGKIYSRTKKGWLELGDKKYYFRSGWEMKYARYLQNIETLKGIKKWEYEVDTFWFDKIKRGVRSYTPDFKIFHNDGSVEYHEVKGWMDAKSKTKLKRMKIYYPNIDVIVIDETDMKRLGLI